MRRNYTPSIFCTGIIEIMAVCRKGDEKMKEYIFEIYAHGIKISEFRTEILNFNYRKSRIANILKEQYAEFGDVKIKIFEEIEEAQGDE